MTTASDLARGSAIAEYRVLDEPPQADFDGLVRLAAMLCGVSTAVINIIDDRHQHQVAAVGFEPDVCAREDSMCAVVFQDSQLTVVPDARLDARFASNPFVTGEIARIRLYASSPVVTPSGIPIGTLCVFDEEVGGLTGQQSEALDLLADQIVDVLELRRMARELSQSNEKLAHFASQVSHDLRNPLAAMAGFIELAVDDPDMAGAPFAVEALARAESATSRMTSMVTNLLDYARVEGAEPHPVETAVEEIVDGVREDLDAMIAETGATVGVTAASSVTADPILLAVLLQNLIANAIKFTHAAGVVPHVEVAVETLDDGWRITVDDNGPGIPIEMRDRVFDRMDRGAALGTPGLGIGLSTCQRIARAHGGGIGVSDSPLGGARVWVALPA